MPGDPVRRYMIRPGAGRLWADSCVRCYRYEPGLRGLCWPCREVCHAEALVEDAARERMRRLRRLLGSCHCRTSGSQAGGVDAPHGVPLDPFTADHHMPGCHLGGWSQKLADWAEGDEDRRYYERSVRGKAGERRHHRWEKRDTRRAVETRAVREGLEEWLEDRAERRAMLAAQEAERYAESRLAVSRDSKGRFTRVAG